MINSIRGSTTCTMFRIFLRSDDPTSNGAQSKFTVRLSESFEEMTKYECALEQIIVPNQMFNIRKGRNHVIVNMTIPRKATGGDWWETVIHNGEIAPGFYSSVSKVVIEAKKIIDEALEPYRELYPDIGDVISMIDDGTRVLVKTPKPISHVDFCYDVGLALGFPPANDYGYGSVYRDAQGLKISAIPRVAENIFIYSNVIQEQCVGDVSTPLLRIVDVDHTNATTTHRSYTSLQFVPVRASFFNSVEVELRDEWGDLIVFTPEAGVVTLVLLFEAIKDR